PPTPPQPADVAVSEIPAAPLPEFRAAHAIVSGDPEPIWPAATQAHIVVPRSAVASAGLEDEHGAPPAQLASRQPVGDSPVRVGAAPARPSVNPSQPVTSDPVEVSVAVADRAATQQAGVTGLMMSLARADGVRAEARVSVEVNYA